MTYLVLILTATLWGLAPLGVKIALHGFSPFSLSLLRFGFALLVLLSVLIFKKVPLPERKNFLRVMMICMFASFNMALFAWGIQFTTTITSAVIYTIVPVITGVFGYLLFKDKLSYLQIAGVAVAFLGLLLIIFLPLLERGEKWEVGSLYGNGFVLLAALSFAAYSLGSQHLSKKYSPLTISAVSIITSLLFFSILAFLENYRGVGMFNLTNFNSLIAIAYLGIGSTFFTFLLYQWLIKSTNAFIASLNGYIQPAITVLAGSFFLKEKISSLFLLGAGLTLLGVFIASNLSLIVGKKISQRYKTL